MTRLLRMSLPVLSSLALLAVVGCKPSLLPGTSIEDNHDNRAVVDFVSQYKDAVEARSAPRVLALVAEDYWEDNGTVDQGDDYGVEKLQSDLEEHFTHAKAIHLKMFVQHVIVDENTGLWSVDYRYNQRALLTFDAGEKWITHTDVNRIVLRPRGDDPADGFLIVAGL
jgi:hypothetical protein